MSTDTTGISEDQFNAELDILVKAYGPEVEAMGYHLVINRLWSDDTVNSDTDTEGKNWVINSYGGLARYAGMTPSGYLAVACHELGHHMGGAPLFSDQTAWGGGGPAVEGEADYWSELICMKRLDPQNQAAAIQVLSNTLASLEGSANPSVATQDKSVVKKVYEDHPAAQCRFDTYMSAMTCPISIGLMSDANPKVNSCYQYPTKKTYSEGSRPLCWFAPIKKSDSDPDPDQD
jgi:hypothetical protein